MIESQIKEYFDGLPDRHSDSDGYVKMAVVDCAIEVNFCSCALCRQDFSSDECPECAEFGCDEDGIPEYFDMLVRPTDTGIVITPDEGVYVFDVNRQDYIRPRNFSFSEIEQLIVSNRTSDNTPFAIEFENIIRELATTYRKDNLTL